MQRISESRVSTVKRLTAKQTGRYDRQMLVPQVGPAGMKKLLAARVTIIGAGGLGCPAAQILAASGVGKLRIIDGDKVELSNLPRQFLHYTKDIGRFKVDSIREKLEAMNPDVTVEGVPAFVDAGNCHELLAGSDYVIIACDTLEAKYLLNDACVVMGLPFTIAGVEQFSGQILSVIPGRTRCLRCFFPHAESEFTGAARPKIGVMAAGPGIAGMVQANEAIKWILGAGSMLVNQLMLFSLIDCSFDVLDIESVPSCHLCLHRQKQFTQMND